MILTFLLVALYSDIAAKLFNDWINNPDSSHGMLIPIFVLYVIWDKRKMLQELPSRPSVSGLILVALSLFVLLAGVFGADLLLSRLSFLLLIAGIFWTLAGSLLLRAISFPIFMLLLSIPLPALVLNRITFPLQLLASRAAGAFLPLVGVPVLREGNIIQLAALRLEVAEACSGIRSLMSLLAVAMMYGYFMEKSIGRRAALALASLPIAVVANSLRIIGTGVCVQYWDPQKAIGFFHEFSGWLIFLFSLISLYLLHSALTKLSEPTGAAG